MNSFLNSQDSNYSNNSQQNNINNNSVDNNLNSRVCENPHSFQNFNFPPENRLNLRDNQVIDCFDFKYQDFWKHSPTEWFNVLERRFIKYNVVNDEDKYFNVLKNLPQDVLVKIDNKLKSLVTGSKYPDLKLALINKYEECETIKIDKLFSGAFLGTRKPSEFLEALTAASSTLDMPRHTILKIWAERLPSYISAHLDPEIALANADAMVEKADKIFFKMKSESKTSINAISHNRDSNFEKIIDNKIEKFFEKFHNSFNNNINKAHREKFVDRTI